jgi:hypothetical protein
MTFSDAHQISNYSINLSKIRNVSPIVKRKIPAYQQAAVPYIGVDYLRLPIKKTTRVNAELDKRGGPFTKASATWW